jgi:hypothetical protein
MTPASRLQVALHLLLQASEYTTDLDGDAWDFAVEVASLLAAGLTINDLRWLLYRGYLAHAVETTGPHDDHRSFRPAGKIALAAASCFILTPTGANFLRDGGAAASSAVPAAPGTALPFWDKDRRALTFANHLVKQFKVPAPNQEMILAAFQEESWPARIDDPLPLHAAIDPKRRLHDTINSLNRNQRQPLLRFLGDGSGEAVRWEPVAMEGVARIAVAAVAR